MKNLNLLFVALIGALTFGLTSCTDECADVVCDNSGVCVEGVCDCPENYYGDNCEVFCEMGTYADGTCGCDAGYEGETCSTEQREKFIGSWSYTSPCFAGTADASTISAVSDNIMRVTLTNLTGYNDNTAYGVVDGSTIMIPAQSVVDTDGDTWQVSSNTATMGADGFTITVTLMINGETTVCEYSYTK
jgi:hypothetical protein